MRHAASMLAFLVAAACSVAAPPEVTKELKIKPGQIVRVPVKADDKAEIGMWRSFKDEEAFFAELVSPTGGSRQFAFQSETPGVYTIVFWSAGEKAGVATVITVGDPAPKPPVPPGPKPPDPPQPADPLAAALRAAWVADGSPASVSLLATAMRDAEAKCSEAAYADTAALAAAVSKTTAALVGAGLPNTRRAVGAHLNATVGTAAGPLTPELRAKIKTEYGRIAAALEGIK